MGHMERESPPPHPTAARTSPMWKQQLCNQSQTLQHSPLILSIIMVPSQRAKLRHISTQFSPLDFSGKGWPKCSQVPSYRVLRCSPQPVSSCLWKGSAHGERSQHATLCLALRTHIKLEKGLLGLLVSIDQTCV